MDDPLLSRVDTMPMLMTMTTALMQMASMMRTKIMDKGLRDPFLSEVTHTCRYDGEVLLRDKGNDVIAAGM